MTLVLIVYSVSITLSNGNQCILDASRWAVTSNVIHLSQQTDCNCCVFEAVLAHRLDCRNTPRSLRQAKGSGDLE